MLQNEQGIYKKQEERLSLLRRSQIKPYMYNLSSSGVQLDGLIIERNLQRPNYEYKAKTNGPPTHIMAIHSRNPARLQWKLNGRRKEIFSECGKIVINPAGVFTAPRLSVQVELILLSISPHLINQIADEISFGGRVELIPRFGFSDELLKQLGVSLIEEFEREPVPDRVYTSSLTHLLVAHLIKKHSIWNAQKQILKNGLPSEKLQKVLDYVNDNLDDSLELEEIAVHANISPSYFITLFKQSMGLAPHQYVLQQRLEKAKMLLKATQIPIVEIAARAGFADQSHLTRLMRRHTGLTPRMFRNR